MKELSCCDICSKTCTEVSPGSAFKDLYDSTMNAVSTAEKRPAYVVKSTVGVLLEGIEAYENKQSVHVVFDGFQFTFVNTHDCFVKNRPGVHRVHIEFVGTEGFIGTIGF